MNAVHLLPASSSNPKRKIYATPLAQDVYSLLPARSTHRGRRVPRAAPSKRTIEQKIAYSANPKINKTTAQNFINLFYRESTG